jgi:carboxylesterase
MVDIAQGLGERVTMLGLSGGALVTAWAAQQRADLDQAVVISPAFGFGRVPTSLTLPLMHAALLLPDKYAWWDPAVQAASLPEHSYPRYSRRALAQILRLGQAVLAAARRQPPAARAIVVVTNANDDKVNNALTGRAVALWRSRGANVSTYEFPAELGLPHDLIEPVPPSELTGMVYAKLIELVGP